MASDDKLNQQVTGTSDSQGDLPHEDIVNPQEESASLHSLSNDVGSIDAFQIVKPNLLVQVHVRTVSHEKRRGQSKKHLDIPMIKKVKNHSFKILRVFLTLLVPPTRTGRSSAILQFVCFASFENQMRKAGLPLLGIQQRQALPVIRIKFAPRRSLDCPNVSLEKRRASNVFVDEYVFDPSPCHVWCRSPMASYEYKATSLPIQSSRFKCGCAPPLRKRCHKRPLSKTSRKTTEILRETKLTWPSSGTKIRMSPRTCSVSGLDHVANQTFWLAIFYLRIKTSILLLAAV